MTYREFTLLFIKFLKEKNALENYKQNCIARIKQGYKRRKNPMYQILNPLLMEEIEEQVERGGLRSTLWNAFCWADSPQGDRYWRKMASEWDEITENIKLNGGLCKEKI